MKKIEYRSVLPCYARLEDPEIKLIVFHYQTGRKLLVKIEKVEKIPLPKHLKTSLIRFTPEVYAIHLGDFRDISEPE